MLLDVTLPDGTGFSVCEKVRKNGSKVPIIFLTALDEEFNVIRGLDSGGDDYITKPFKLGELCSRIRALLRRAGMAKPTSPSLLNCGDVSVDFLHSHVISIISADNTCSIDSNLVKTLQDNPKVKRAYGRMFAYDVPVKTDGQNKKINLISYEEHQFSWAKKSLIEGSLDEVKQKDNQALTVYDTENTLHVGDTLSLDLGKGQKKVTVAGLLSSSPFDRVEGAETVICSESTFRKLTGKTDYTIIDLQLSNTATDDDVNAIHSLTGSDIKFSDQRESNREVKGAFYSMALFIYGFLVIIAMIAIFNIVNSIAMSVSARIRQYGAMRAIGMSGRQLIKMITAEAVTYSVAGSIVGCLLGLPLHKMLFEQMVTSHWGTPWQFPLGVLAIIVAVVIISSILAVHGPAKQIQKMSIVDTISAQ